MDSEHHKWTEWDDHECKWKNHGGFLIDGPGLPVFNKCRTPAIRREKHPTEDFVLLNWILNKSFELITSYNYCPLKHIKTY